MNTEDKRNWLKTKLDCSNDDTLIDVLYAKLRAADALAFQYQGLLDWIANEECECCHCDDHDKLVEVLHAYRKIDYQVEL